MKVIRSSAMIIAMNKGISGLITWVIFKLAIEQPTNSPETPGGVKSPINKLKTIIIPKWTSLIPSSWTIGRNIGVNIKTAGVMSINIPTNSRIRLISNKMTMGLSLNDNNQTLKLCGRSSYAITHDIPILQSTRNNTIPEVLQVLIKMGSKS